MKQYDKIIASGLGVADTIDEVLAAFNHRRRHNNTTVMEDMQIVTLHEFFYVVMIVSYDDYKPDTRKAPPERPRWIGHQPESGTINPAEPSPFMKPARQRFISTDHSDE